MKKGICLALILVLILGLTGIPTFANGLPDVQTVTLYAGQDIPVGEVQVWDDDVNLYVMYLITEEGWEMTEAHVAVGEIPVTKKGNAVPGQFPYSMCFDPAVLTYTFVIPAADLEWEDWENIPIAAHASVQHVVELEIMPEITWTRSPEDNPETPEREVFYTPGYGGAWTYAGVIGNFPALDMSAANVWDNGMYSEHVVAGAQYASWKYAYTNPDGGNYAGQSDLRLFRGTFSIPEDYTAFTADLGVVGFPDHIPINDNLYVYVNGELVFWGGTRANVLPDHEGMAGVQAIQAKPAHMETDGWYIVGTFPQLDTLVTGGNVIEIFAEENQGWGGMGKPELTLDGIQIDQTESAWAAYEPGSILINPDKGSWGTYFLYNWMSWMLVDAFDVMANDADGENSMTLEDGGMYRVVVSGTYTFLPGWFPAGIADARYSFRRSGSEGYPYFNNTGEDAWIDGADLTGYAHYLQLWADGAWVEWNGSYDDHIYDLDVTGTGVPMNFTIMDNNYGDNSGALQVEIYWYH